MATVDVSHPKRLVARVRGAVRRHGAVGAARHAAVRTVRVARTRAYLSEMHIWYEFPLWDASPDPVDGYRIRQGTESDAAELEQLGLLRLPAAREYLAEGAQLWVATHGDELVYMVWFHRDWVPAIAAAGGRLQLPPGVACLENAFALPAHRHLGVGRCVIKRAVLSHANAGFEHVVAKVAEDNIASRKSVAKLDGREAARMHFRRIGFARRVRVESLGNADLAAALAERLS